MTKKDFIALASYLTDTALDNWAADVHGNIDRQKLREHLANFCHSQNYNFKRDRWLDYIAGKCGKNGGKVAAPELTQEQITNRNTRGTVA